METWYGISSWRALRPFLTCDFTELEHINRNKKLNLYFQAMCASIVVLIVITLIVIGFYTKKSLNLRHNRKIS